MSSDILKPVEYNSSITQLMSSLLLVDFFCDSLMIELISSSDKMLGKEKLILGVSIFSKRLSAL